MKTSALTLTLIAFAAASATAAPVTYTIDPTHTYPSFEADHMGISVWRGKMNKTTGTVVLDKTAGSGTVALTIDPASISFGMPLLDKWARGKDFFDVKKHPKASYKGTLEGFVDGAPTKVVGELTLHGVTRPVELKIDLFKCVPHPMNKAMEICGADASTTIQRDEFGLDAGKAYGFKMAVDLAIQVEASAPKPAP